MLTNGKTCCFDMEHKCTLKRSWCIFNELVINGIVEWNLITAFLARKSEELNKYPVFVPYALERFYLDYVPKLWLL